MRTVPFRDGLLFPIAHLLGIDPKADLNKDHAAAWCSFINSRTREAWEFWDWTELDITEERAFRTIWNASRDVNVGDELLYIPTFSYYRAIAQPPVGTLPTDIAFYEPIQLNDFYIEQDQVGRRPIGQVIGAWAGSPRIAPNVGNISLGFRPSTKGYDINPAGSNGVSAWLTYRLKPSEFTVEEFDSGKTYQAGDLMYWLTDGNCYQSIQANSGNDPGVPGYWRVVKMPWILVEFVKYAVAADACDDINSTQLWRTYADEAITQRVNRLLEQGQRYYYRMPRYCGYWSYAPLGFVFNGSGSGSSLSDQDDDFIPDAIPRFPTLETGVTPLTIGQAWVDVVFVTPKATPNYHFAELVVQFENGAPPFIIRAELVTARTTTGFRAVLNAGPFGAGYSLRWRVTS